MKKLLILITKSNWGGAQRYVYDLATNVDKTLYEVTVACGGEGELVERLKASGIQTVTIPHLGRDISFADEINSSIFLYKLIGSMRPDIVHLNSSKMGGLGGLVARIQGVPRIVFTLHGLAINENRDFFSKLIITLAYACIVILSHTTIAVSGALKSQMSGLLDLPLPWKLSNKIKIIRNGLNSINFIDRSEARKYLDSICPSQDIVNPSRFVIGTIGELHPIKGHKFLLHGFKQLLLTLPIEKAQLPKLIIMGEGEERANLEKTIAELDLKERVCLAGHVKDASTYLKAFDVFVIPSLSEGLSYVALEAGQASLPVISSKVGGLPEIIEDNVSGLLIPSQDPKAISDSIYKLILNPDLGPNLGKNLVNKVQTEFSLKKMLESTVEQYKIYS